MRIILALLGLFALAGCSSLQRYHEFRFEEDAESNVNQISSSCTVTKSEDETLTVKFDAENEIKIRFGLHSSAFWLMGPPLIPFIPSWHSYGHNLFGLDIIASPGVSFTKENWKVVTPFGESVARKIGADPNVSCAPEVTVQEVFQMAASEKFDERCQRQKIQFVLFEIPKKEIPDSLTLVLEGFVVKNKIQPTRKLHFKHSSFFAYGAYGPANERLYGQTASCE